MAFDHLKGIIFILIILWFVWFFWGRSSDTSKPFLKAPAPIDTGEVYGPQ